VNFLGPDDEWVTSGSDDGNFFIWNKLTASLHGIYEGDGSVVNMVEGHPYLPLVAVSGIDTTVKVSVNIVRYQHFLSPSQLFAPTTSATSSFSKLADAEQIVQINKRLGTTRSVRYTELAALLAEAQSGGEVIIEAPRCVGQ